MKLEAKDFGFSIQLIFRSKALIAVAIKSLFILIAATFIPKSPISCSF